MKQLQTFKTHFDQLFNSHLKDLITSTNEYNPEFSELGEHFLLLSKGGKRIRPYMCVLAYETGGGKDVQSIVPALFAFELFQLSALIHDDIMDQATTRHGVLCIHEKFDFKQAILMGNLCTIWALQSIHSIQETSRDILNQFILLLEETNIGQMIDTSLAQRVDVNRELINRSIELKTARYTFTYPILIGFSFAHNHTYDEDSISLGHYLGSAFQRLNDVADIMCTEEVLGKKPCADITEQTPTHLLCAFNERATGEQKETLEMYFGKTLTAIEVSEIQKLFKKSGAYDYERDRIETLFTHAIKIIQHMKILPIHKVKWLSLISYLRSKLYMMQ